MKEKSAYEEFYGSRPGIYDQTLMMMTHYIFVGALCIFGLTGFLWVAEFSDRVVGNIIGSITFVWLLGGSFISFWMLLEDKERYNQ